MTIHLEEFDYYTLAKGEIKERLNNPSNRDIDAAFAEVLHESYDRHPNEHPMDTKKRLAIAALRGFAKLL